MLFLEAFLLGKAAQTPMLGKAAWTPMLRKAAQTPMLGKAAWTPMLRKVAQTPMLGKAAQTPMLGKVAQTPMYVCKLTWNLSESFLSWEIRCFWKNSLLSVFFMDLWNLIQSSFCLLTSMELILKPNCSLLYYRWILKEEVLVMLIMVCGYNGL